jgi:hypothetical protein
MSSTDFTSDLGCALHAYKQSQSTFDNEFIKATVEVLCKAEDDEPTPERTEALLNLATLVMKTHAPDVGVLGDPIPEY